MREEFGEKMRYIWREKVTDRSRFGVRNRGKERGGGGERERERESNREIEIIT